MADTKGAHMASNTSIDRHYARALLICARARKGAKTEQYCRELIAHEWECKVDKVLHFVSAQKTIAADYAEQIAQMIGVDWKVIKDRADKLNS